MEESIPKRFHEERVQATFLPRRMEHLWAEERDPLK
jgi:hypothetical protein